MKELPNIEVAPVFQLFTDLESESDLDIKYPMYSPWAVGMPSPGSDFINWAELRGGDKIPKIVAGLEPKTKTKSMEWLEALYRAALYKFPYEMPVLSKDKARTHTARFVPGCLWHEAAADTGFAGPTSAKVMVVGKHPGWEEASTGTNFSGPTSTELIRALEELGVEDWESWYVTNVVKHPHLQPAKSNTVPVAWIKNCLPLLYQEFRLVRPDYLLILGDDAVKAILGKSHNISNTSGQVLELVIPRHEFSHEEPSFHTIKVMTATHPARVARQPDVYPQMLGAIRQFVNLTRGESVGDKEEGLEFSYISDKQALKTWADEVIESKANMFAVDCEWHGSGPGNPGAYLRTVQVAWAAKKSMALILRNAEGKEFEGEWLTQMSRVLKTTEGRKTRIVGHNFRSDLPWLLYYGLDLRPEFDVPEDDPDPDGETRLFGWQKTRTEGGIDTLLAVHSWQETHPLGLEACTSQLLGIPRYDIPLEEWKTEYCKANKMKKSELEGYGDVPDDILNPYACYDADATWRLAELLNKPGGLLDYDRYGNDSRKAFWVAMRASPAFLEMETQGVLIDRRRAEVLTESYMTIKDKLLQEFRTEIKWDSFNPSSPRHKVELLFGEHFHAKKGLKLRPEECASLCLDPIKSTGKRPSMWKDVKLKAKYDPSKLEDFTPATDKETMGILAFNSSKDPRYALVRKLRDISFIGQLLRTVLRPPATLIQTTETEDDVETEELLETDEAGDKVYEKGIISQMHADGRVRPHFLQAAETGRVRCSKPNLQNWCVDGDTEILTKKGFIKFKDLDPELEVAQFSPKTKEISFTKPLDFNKRHYKGQMYSISGQTYETFATPNHTCLVWTGLEHENSEHSTLSCEDLVDGNIRGRVGFAIAGYYRSGKKFLTSDWASWLTYVMLEGDYTDDGITLEVQEEKLVSKLTDTLVKIGANYSVVTDLASTKYLAKISVLSENNKQIISFTKKLLGPDNCLGEWILDYEYESLVMLADELFAKTGVAFMRKVFTSYNKKQINWLQVLCTLTATKSLVRNKTTNLSSVTLVSDERSYLAFIERRSCKKQNFDDYVYCVTVPSGFIVTRRNGKVTVTGNSKRREPDYQRIAGADYKYPLRSIIVASPGCVFMEADYTAAEVAGVALLSRDEKLMDHARRSTLSENDPDFFDIHSNIAVRAFKLNCKPTKEGLKSVGKSAIRTAAKAVFFGYLYGQGAESAARKAREEGADVTVQEAQALIDSLDSTYPRLKELFDICKQRAVEPGWLQNSFGRLRRFSPSTDRQVIGESQRQAMNFPIQSLVADVVSRALDFLYNYRLHNDVDYKIALQIHDAVILEVPIKHAHKVYHEVLPKCMIDMVDIWPSYLDGTRIPGIEKPHKFGIGRDVYLYWGEDIPLLANKVLGVPEEFCNKKADHKSLLDLYKVPGWDKHFDMEALNDLTDD